MLKDNQGKAWLNNKYTYIYSFLCNVGEPYCLGIITYSYGAGEWFE